MRRVGTVLHDQANGDRPQHRGAEHVDAHEQRGHLVEVLDVADRPLEQGDDDPRRDPLGQLGALRRPPTQAPGENAASATTASTTLVPWTRAASAIATPNRRASSSPACGPAPVTTVPVTRASAVRAATPAVCRMISGETGRTTTPSSGSDARRTRTTALATRTRDNSMCPCTAAGWRSTSTVTPPSTIWATTPVTRPSDSTVRSPPARTADQRAEHGGDHGEADEPGEQAIDLLDRRVARRDIDELGAAARRPVGATQT